MRRRGILAILFVAVVAVGALVFSIGTLALTAAEYLARSGPPPTIEDADLGTLEVYRVLDDASLDPLPTGLAATVWGTYVRVVGADFAASTMHSFQTGSNEDSDLLAWVIRADGDVDRWDLAANLAYSDDEAELLATLVHEYAHILSLNAAEVEPFVKVCDTLELDEGCAKTDSYVLAFQAAFWSTYGDAAPDPTNVDDEIADAFYGEHEDDFVSAYAATNVVEDFAETFMTYVLEPDVEDAADSAVADKLRFFAAYPELADIRDRIRTEFAASL